MTTQAGQAELVIQQGATWYLPVAVYVSDGAGGESLLDTTGYSGRFTVRDGGFDGPAVVNLTTAGGGVVTGYTPAARADSTAYGLGQVVTPATLNGFVYEATVAGTSGASAPTWPTVAGATVADGTVTWTAQAAGDRISNAYAYLSATQTAALDDWGFGVYTFEVTDTYGAVLRVIEGTCRLSREASY